MKKGIFLLLANCIIMFSACQSDIEKADNLRLENKFEEAAELYQQLADEGDAYAKWCLANAYSNGDGVDFDRSKELELLKQDADEGCEEAKCDLAFAYMFGWYDEIGKDSLKGKEMLEELVKNSSNSYVMSKYAYLFLIGDPPYEENKEKAIRILNKINDKDNSFYNYAMGYVYLNGTDDIEINVEKAIEYLTKSFNNGIRISAHLIQGIYAKGYGDVKKDIKKQLEWIKRGIEANGTSCMIDMSNICLSEDSTYKEYNNPQRGVELLKRAARNGSSQALFILGNFYNSGEHLPKDDKKAFENWEKSAQLKDPNGLTNLAYAYLEGIGCEKDVRKAVELYKKAANNGSGFSANLLYSVYYYGKYGVKIDREMAKRYLLKAVELNEPWGYYNLGNAYFNGDMVDKSIEQAFVYIKKAADLGLVDACESIAYFYENGMGCDKDPNKAKEYRDKTIASDDKKKE